MRLIVSLSALLAIFGSIEAFVDPHCDGKQVVVHLFEWKWTDVALECERFLAPAGYCGVQISPPHEHVFLPEDNCPWWQRYQLVSYQLESRSGTRDQFVDMVHRCNAVGVRIFADVILNHAAGMGRKGPGFAGTDFDTTDDKHDFPGIPYSDENFTPRELCPSDSGSVDNYSVEDNVRNCYLVGLSDLYGAQEYVQQKQADYLNDMIDIGVAGFRVDAAKHMWAEDIAAIQALLKPLNVEQGFKAGSQPFFMHEVIDRDDGVVRVQEYYDLGIVTEFRYSQKMAWASTGDWGQFGGLYDPGWGMSDPEHAFVFVDNHDNQRGHGGSGDVVTFKDGKLYAYAVSAMLASEYGFTRVMSSYDFDNSDQGPPSLDDFVTSDVTINEDGSCGGGWVCEHRWNAIAKMVQFRNAVAGAPQENFWSEGDSMGLSRTGKGFFAMSQRSGFTASVQTGLPGGDYCNIIDSCASSVTVQSDGTADISINNDDGVLAICVGCKGDEIVPGPTSAPGETTTKTTITTMITFDTTTTATSQDTTLPDTDTTIEFSTPPAATECCTTINVQTDSSPDDSIKDVFGEYSFTGVSEDGYPIYRIDGDGLNYLYFINDFSHHFKGWIIGEDSTSDVGKISREGDEHCIEGKSDEWYYVMANELVPVDSITVDCVGGPNPTNPGTDDTTTKTTPGSSGECCDGIFFGSTGGIGDDLPAIQGNYLMSEVGDTGRLVYEHESGQYFLYYHDDPAFHFKGWLISIDPTSNDWIALNEGVAECAQDLSSGWEFFMENQWVQDSSVTVDCIA
ncbi:alpha-amylase-like [Tigriopus californicus]|nr:alpha-amylase-like [Tigriopus californicus]